MIELFKTALTDYKYRKVYKLYLTYLTSVKDTVPKETIKAVFESALKIYSLDYNKAQKMWDLYI